MLNFLLHIKFDDGTVSHKLFLTGKIYNKGRLKKYWGGGSRQYFLIVICYRETISKIPVINASLPSPLKMYLSLLILITPPMWLHQNTHQKSHSQSIPRLIINSIHKSFILKGFTKTLGTIQIYPATIYISILNPSSKK